MKHAFLATLLIAAGLFNLACEGRARSVAGPAKNATTTRSEPHIAVLNLKRGTPELSRENLFSRSANNSYADLILALDALTKEEQLRGVLVQLGTGRLGFAPAEELGRALQSLRDRKLPVRCHADAYSNATLLLAARACDQIWLTPAGTVNTVGLAGQLLFGRALLERLAVNVDFLQVGKYKGASEPFTRDSASPEARQSLQDTLASLRLAWISGIETGRAKKAVELGLEDGPHTAPKALTLGLVDKLAYAKDASRTLIESAGAEGTVAYFGDAAGQSGGLAEVVRAFSGTRGIQGPHIAVVRAAGAITIKANSSPFGKAGGIAERRLSPLLRKLTENPNVKAVVLRIDSPGGSALASDLLWRSLMDLRETKPLVVSIGSMAASGGYFMAAAANKIFAERTSIIGSIGVVAGKLSFERSLESIGVHVEAVPAKAGGEQPALYGSPLQAWNETTRAKVKEAITTTYELFIERVAEGRKLPAERIEQAAEGRLMGGEAAKTASLIDELGGLRDAIAAARALASLSDDTPVHIADQSAGLFELLQSGDTESQNRAARHVQSKAARLLFSDLDGPLLDFRDHIGTFVSSFWPLLQDEATIAALPYVLAVR